MTGRAEPRKAKDQGTQGGGRQPAPPKVPHPSAEEREARGKAARGKVAPSEQAGWEPTTSRPDPIDVLEDQAKARVADLIPIRYGRMASSPFAFYRGAAAIMASDLAATPRSGIKAQLCGDAHLSNFGGFASPGRVLVFDINDFDETLPGPWEWDVKRLAASFAIAGRELGLGAKERRSIVRAAVAEYRTTIRTFAGMRNLDIWYTRLDEASIQARFGDEAGRKVLKTLDRSMEKARTKDSLRAFSKLTHLVNGEPRIVSDPPLIVPIEEVSDANPAWIMTALEGLLGRYRRTLEGDRRHLLESFRLVHAARKVVGVGSVGTRTWIALLLGRDGRDPLFLQFKEAQPSVLARFAGKSVYADQGQRVVEGQRLMQATSDIFLGWEAIRGIDGATRDFYVRQLWDWKVTPDIETMIPRGIGIYGEMCGWTLARAHARSGDRIAMAAYLGADDRFDKAIATFAETYADQNERDHRALVEAVSSGRIKAETGV